MAHLVLGVSMGIAFDLAPLAACSEAGSVGWAPRIRRCGAAASLAFTAGMPGSANAQWDAILQGLTGVRPYAPSPPPPYPYRPGPYPPPGYQPGYQPGHPQAAPVYPQAQQPRPARVAADPQVAELQRLLNELGYDAGTADGAPGPRTVQAIRAFQRDHGQPPSGEITPETVAVVRAAWHERSRGIATAPTPAPAAVAAAAPIPDLSKTKAIPTEGKYCLFGPGNSYDMLVVRDGGVSLEFGLSSWLPNGSNFSVSGSAMPVETGWRYESGMKSRDKTERCAVTIERTPDGTYRVATVEGARCEAYAGHGAVLEGTNSFPPESRVGNAPLSLAVGPAASVGCDRPRSGAPTRAVAQPARYPGVLFAGSAQTGSDTRPVQFRFECTPGRGRTAAAQLSLRMEVSGGEQLKGILDLDEFEGPYPSARSAPRLRATSAGSSVEHEFGASGFFGGHSAFVLETGEEQRKGVGNSGKLASVLGVLTDGPSQLLWRQNNPKPDGPAMNATLDLTAEDAAVLGTTLAPCLPGR